MTIVMANNGRITAEGHSGDESVCTAVSVLMSVCGEVDEHAVYESGICSANVGEGEVYRAVCGVFDKLAKQYPVNVIFTCANE